MKALLALSLLPLAALPLVPPAAEAPARKPAEFRIDGTHSVVLFRTRHVGVSYFHGRFNHVSGEVAYDANAPQNSFIRVIVAADSVDTNSENRDRHLKSPDFLSAQEFPEIVFESTKVAAKGTKLQVTGDLTLHGVTKEITIEAEKVGEGETPFNDYRVGFEAVFEVDPREFGIRYMTQNENALGPGVRMTVAIECVREE